MIFSIWLTAIIIQSGITIFLAMQFFRYKPKSQPKFNSLSIVIAVHNEYSNLQQLIPALLNQDYKDFEIVIGLDRCTDNSKSYLQRLNNEKIKLVEINETPSDWDYKKYALNSAISASNNKWIVFTDADCLPNSKGWLNQIDAHLEEGKTIMLGYSPYTSSDTLLNTFIQFETFLTAFNYLSSAIIGNPYMGVGRNLVVEKSFFKKKGGYESFKSIVGGDDDLFIQANATSHNTGVMLGKEAIMYSKPKNSWNEYIHQKTRHLSVGTNYSIKDQLFHVLFSTSLILVWLLLLFISIENIVPIILIYLLVKWIGYRFAHSKLGVGFNYIWLPLVDLMYAIFLPIIAIRSKLVKDIRWKN